MDIDALREMADMLHIDPVRTYSEEEYEELERRCELVEEENEELKDYVSEIKGLIENLEKSIKYKF